MSIFTSKKLLLCLSLLLFIALTAGNTHISHTFRGRGDGGGVERGVVGLDTRRSLVDGNLQNSSLILAEERTRRKDPLDDFHKYTGGWNISNDHYWASVAWTAVPFFVVAGLWLVIFGVSLTLICFCYCCCPREPYGYSRTAYALSLILLIFFTVAAIVGCIVLYTGQGKFHSSTTKTLNYVVSQADTTVESLRNLSGSLGAAKRIGVDSIFLPSDVQSNIDTTITKLNSAATKLSNTTKKNSKRIDDVLDSIRLALIVVAAVMLCLAFLGFLFSILGMQAFVYFLVIFGWILVAGTFILCGIFLLAHKQAIYRSVFECKKCQKSYSSKDIYLDLTVTAGLKKYVEVKPAGTEFFRRPFVSFIYERGWRQYFGGGFPGPDEEFKMAQEYFNPAKGGVLVDVSCGSGMFARKFAKSGTYAGVVALDFSENMLRQCYGFVTRDPTTLLAANLALVRADVSRLPFASGSVDAVHAGAALHCWPSPSNAVAEITRVLRSGGIFVGTTFLRSSPSTPWIFKPFRERIHQTNTYLTEEELEDLCTSCGLTNYSIKVQQSFIMFSAQKP